MPPAKRRKLAPASETQDSNTAEDTTQRSEQPDSTEQSQQGDRPDPEPPVATATEASLADKNKERQERFKALQARAVSESLRIHNLITY